jgi:outer membrane protein
MKKMIFSLGSILALSLMSATGFAADAAIKIGVVDLRQVLQKSPQMTDLNKKLEAQFKPRQDKIKADEKLLQADVDKLKKDGSTMSKDDVTKLQDKIVKAQSALQAQVGTFQQDLGNAQNQGMQKLLQDAGAIITDMGKKDAYTLIVSKEAAFYAQDSMDLTPKVSQAMSSAKAK